MAVAPDGHLAGHTQLLFPAASPEVYQWDTVTDQYEALIRRLVASR